MKRYTIKYAGHYTAKIPLKGEWVEGRIYTMYVMDCFLDFHKGIYTLSIPSALPFATKRVVGQALGDNLSQANLWASQEQSLCTVTSNRRVISKLINIREECMENTDNITPEMLSVHVPDPDNYVYVDGWTSGNPGRGGFMCVDIDKNILFHKDYDDPHSNNWYELAAIAAAAIKCPGRTIWSDSITAIAWAQGRMGKGARAKYDEDESFHAMIKAIRDNAPTILKWSTELWGEIPADLGRKG